MLHDLIVCSYTITSLIDSLNDSNYILQNSIYIISCN